MAINFHTSPKASFNDPMKVLFFSISPVGSGTILKRRTISNSPGISVRGVM